MKSNTEKLSELGKEEGNKVAQNVAAGVAGLVIWPLWFAMDFQNAAGKEVTALQSRQQYLATLAEQRCGAVVPVPVQTVTPTPTAPAQPATPTAGGAAPAAVVPVSATSDLIDCVDTDGSVSKVAGSSCPPGWKPAQ
ncbi:hypothetical protein [Reyranella sp.]|uniref:hypothetical protein n=1 Tax=Reyranella sp. TaxID=1929291 RepID=UPI003BAC8327